MAWVSGQQTCLCLLYARREVLQVAEANRQWMEEEDGIIDDCTVIVAFLDVSAPPASTVKNGSKSKKFAGTEGSVSKAFSHVAKKASFLLTPQEMIQKVNIGGSRK